LGDTTVAVSSTDGPHGPALVERHRSVEVCSVSQADRIGAGCASTGLRSAVVAGVDRAADVLDDVAAFGDPSAP
jgi:hypothetical protein